MTRCGDVGGEVARGIRAVWCGGQRPERAAKTSEGGRWLLESFICVRTMRKFLFLRDGGLSIRNVSQGEIKVSTRISNVPDEGRCMMVSGASRRRAVERWAELEEDAIESTRGWRRLARERN